MIEYYSFVKETTPIPKEFVSLHDVQIKRILRNKNTVKLVCDNCFHVIRNTEVFCVHSGIITLKGCSPRDYTCHVYYGKATAKGEVLIGLPITLRELDRYLLDNSVVIELFQEFYSSTGLYLKGNIQYKCQTLGVDWEHVIIEISDNPIIEYSGLICTEDISHSK